jgi:hypothetical protein
MIDTPASVGTAVSETERVSTVAKKPVGNRFTE